MEAHTSSDNDKEPCEKEGKKKEEKSKTLESDIGKTTTIAMEQTDQSIETGETKKQTEQSDQPTETGDVNKQIEQSEQPTNTGDTNKQTEQSDQPTNTGDTNKQTEQSDQPTETGDVNKQIKQIDQPTDTGDTNKQIEQSDQPTETDETNKQTECRTDSTYNLKDNKQTELIDQPMETDETNKQTECQTDDASKLKDNGDQIISSQIETESTDLEKDIKENLISMTAKDQDETKSKSKTEQIVGEGIETEAVEKKIDEPGEMETTLSKTAKETYANQFEKFLLQTQEKEDSVQETATKSQNGTEDTNQSQPKRKMFEQIQFEETSNSSWYKMSDNKEESMDVLEANLPPDENSNMSVPDNSSVVSSNIGDSCISFPDQVSNNDECSNLSVPDDSCSVPVFGGHQPVFDESANMNPPSNVTFIQPDTPRSVDADANSETTPVKRSRRGTLQIAAEDASEHGHDLTAADIFEYQWPLEPDAEYYILQEQISIYLDIKSFKRKYPDLFRRVCDKHEKDFLREKGVVSETQSDLGLTALKSDEVHDLMSKDYPAKYKEFLKILHEREKVKMANKLKEYVPKLEKEKMIEYTKKVMKATSDWNRNLLKERNESRRAYFDMQTFTIQYPKSKFRKLENVKTEVTAYPLSLIPGQFQDYCRKYTPEELKYFPLNTAIFDPPKKVDAMTAQQQQLEEDTESQEDETQKTGSVSGSGSEDDSSSSDSESENEEEAKVEVTSKKEKSSSRETSKEKSAEPPVVKEEPAECRICKEESEKKGKQKQQKVVDEELIHCSECKKSGHPSCLDLTEEMVKIIKTYPWQCMECKTCVQCMDPYDEDKMLFCDKCDRGYHTFCVGLKSLPTGKWECMSCRGDNTPIKPIPKPTPKSRRGRKPRDLNGKQTPSKEAGKQTSNKEAGKQLTGKETGKQTPSREAKESLKDKSAAKEAK